MKRGFIGVFFAILFISVFVSAVYISGSVADNQTAKTNFTCIDSDNGKNYFVKGHVQSYVGIVTDICIGTTQLSEAYCPSDSSPEIGVASVTCPAGNICSEGACITAPFNYSYTQPCADSDGGLNYYKRGTARSSVASITDSCNSLGQLVEAHCVSTDLNAVEKTIVACSAGYMCREGTCINATSNYTNSNETLPANITTDAVCTDSDGGLNYYTRGKTTSIKEGVPSYGTDYCNYYNISSKLVEYYCNGNTMSINPYTCINGCSEGVCITSSNSVIPNETAQFNTTPELNTYPDEHSNKSTTTPATTEGNNLTCTSGCLLVKTCLPYGYRTSLNYCNIDNNLVKQINEGSCNNNFECTSNICANSECISPGLLQKILNWVKSLFGAK